MHVVLEKEHFLKALAHQQSVIEKKTTVPILSHVLLTTEEASPGNPGTLTLTGTDLELCLVEKIPAQIKQAGSVAVAAHTLYDVVRKLRDGAPIELALLDDLILTLVCAPSEFTFPTLSLAEFPAMTQQELPHKFTLFSNDFRQLIDQTRFAMSTEEARYYLNGIYFHRADQDLRAVATDAHRLALSWIPLPNAASDVPGIILSRKTIHEVRKLIDGIDQDIHIAVSSKQISFSAGEAIFYSRLIEGNFPDYHKAIPQQNTHMVSVNATALAEAVDRISMVSSEKSRVIKIHVSTNCITLSARSTEHGQAREELEATYDGEPVEMGFTARYILDVAQQIKGDLLHIYLGEAGAPALIKDPKDEQALYVLMPMRV